MSIWCDIGTTVIVALISAMALVKSSKSNVSDKITRGQWAFEEFIMSFERYSSIMDEKQLVEFHEKATLCYLYINNEMKGNVIAIRNLVDENKLQEARERIVQLMDAYYEKNKVGKYNG